MKRLRVMILTVVFILTMALPAMAQGNQSNSPVSKSSFESAMFNGIQGSIETYTTLTADPENKGQYILYLEKYNFDANVYYFGSAVVPSSDVVFNTTKGTVKVNKTVALTKVEDVYDEENDAYYTIETPAGDESVDLTWAFNPRNYSTHKYVDRNIEIDFNQYLQLSKATIKDYSNVTVSGKIGNAGTEELDHSGASVFTGTSFTIIK
ncbi:hypothetical protein WQ54_28665 [Bacillus sp. SA1-12]|uniref:hypothetical protein n=1 Tax=Bacillus sp. SA1-12 TaxID=1455638 RepID=UPI000626F1A8|nr:hypothetical protein [Bacillus sp. SA1-12]KKI88901.1 hypothetical protein WQ54_28665 [Bacillus sp. SA1-12]